ncbi:MAG: Metal-dependent hydrolases of the beta-lactamase superfamily I [uncultured Paraburkholderia sp.]|nr:MAG: Metal-dependent hydrolases of the beta-lactamase superfamily I [uncultured Paraburkholderia sp.]
MRFASLGSGSEGNALLVEAQSDVTATRACCSTAVSRRRKSSGGLGGSARASKVSRDSDYA